MAEPEGRSFGPALSVAFYGDSIVTGWRGITSPDHRWTSMVCRRLGWHEINIAADGLGFVHWRGPGQTHTGAPLGLVTEVLSAPADLVVVALGGNDSLLVDGYESEIELAIGRDLTALVDTYGADRVVVLDLYSPHGTTKPPGWTAVRSLLSAKTHDMGLRYVHGQADAIGGDHHLLCDDLLHPNDAGHGVLADAVVDELSDVARQLTTA